MSQNNQSKLTSTSNQIRPAMVPVEFISQSVAHTQRAGSALAQLLQPGDIIWLEGDLGAGKTTFTKGVAQGLGVTGYVNSPTFTLVNEYQGRMPIYHMD